MTCCCLLYVMTIVSVHLERKMQINRICFMDCDESVWQNSVPDITLIFMYLMNVS